MIELTHDALNFSFSEVHQDAHMSIEFQRTLRIPDDGEVHYLPPGLGRFPVRHIDDYSTKVPAAWKKHGGVIMPMWQAEALWVNFHSREGYPFLVKIATGKINAVSGEEWREGAHRDPQDYVVVPGQPWLDGYCVKKGEIAQFVAMPLGQGYSAEEQITGKAEHGGLQVMVYPMKAEEWEKILEERRKEEAEWSGLRAMESPRTMFCISDVDMGLAPGGRMKQSIKEDPYDMSVWDLRQGRRCFVHIANSLTWRAITGERPPTTPPTALQYQQAGLPWFDHYSDGKDLAGSDQLAGIQTVLEMGKKKGVNPLPENDPFDPDSVNVIKLGKDKDVVREGDF